MEKAKDKSLFDNEEIVIKNELTHEERNRLHVELMKNELTKRKENNDY